MLFWAFILLALFQAAGGIFLSNLSMDFVRNPTADVNARREVFRYYGTFSRSFLTMFATITLPMFAAVFSLHHAYIIFSTDGCMSCFKSSVTRFVQETDILWILWRASPVFNIFVHQLVVALPCCSCLQEVLFANWGPPCRVLVDNISQWYTVFFLIFRCVFGFAILCPGSKSDIHRQETF